jgi:hypothetical protein
MLEARPNVIGLTVLVVDQEAARRRTLVESLRRLGLHAIGIYLPTDAVALLDGIAADVVLVRSDDEDTALAYLRTRTILIRVEDAASNDDAVAELLRAFGGIEATLN